jgi:magnesium transporter
MIVITSWHRVQKTLQTVEPAQLLQQRERLNSPDEVFWIDLSDPTEAEEDLVLKEILPIHTLSLEDVRLLRRNPTSPPHFPKVEEFPDYLFVIVNPFRQSFMEWIKNPGSGEGRGRAFTQLSAVLTGQVLVTHHQESMPCIEEIKAFLGRHQAHLDRGPDFIFHLVLDNLVDEYAPALDHLDDALETMEEQLILRPTKELYTQLLQLKRGIIVLRKTLIAQREILVRLSRGEFALVDEREMAYYRNVYDHLVRFTELIESSREMASDLMQSYLAAISNRLNEIMKVLTMISTIVLPMTLVAGIYGMNFKHMPELEQTWGYPLALVVMLAMGLGSLALFWWKKWL